MTNDLLQKCSILLLVLSGCDSLIYKGESDYCASGWVCPPGKKCAARQDACITDNCGNGKLDPGEVCDDGNIIDGDGCSHNCKSNETCGNGILDTAAGEVCDDGNTVSGDGCSADCRSLEGCGNGKVENGEDCDSGPSGTPMVAKETSICNSDCTWAKHGDGKVNKAAGEDCDGDSQGKGNGRDCESPACNADCTVSAHGDGKVNASAGEQCDGDNLGHGNGKDCESPTCNFNCTANKCGDGVVNSSAKEDCDRDGTIGHPGQPGPTGESASCNSDCRVSKHGDGKVNASAGEQCDGDSLGHGNGKDCESATCNHDCTPARCGDGIVNPTAGEACDRDGTVGHDGQSGQTGQSATCTPECQKSVCGDHFVNAMAGEKCDDGVDNSYTGDCLPGVCVPNICGDGKVNLKLNQWGHAKEECDNGSANSDTGDCTANCTNAFCGDGHVHARVEQCDDGPSSATAKTECPYGQKSCTLCSGCKTVQLTGPYCGDGKTNGGEACDDGAKNGATSCDYGSGTCQICNSDCSQKMTRSGPYCGDGTKNGPEVCDDGNSSNETECVYGVPTCTACNSTCTQVLNLKGAYCGDGTLNGTEACDSKYAFVCGTCVPPDALPTQTSCTAITAGQSSGSLAVASSDLVGATFTLADMTTTDTFEFVSGNSPLAGHLAIDISVAGGGAPTPSFIASQSANAITRSGLKILVTYASGASSLSLTNNDYAGLFGNIPITYTPHQPSQAAALVVTGMSGGAGCPARQLCKDDSDCASTLGKCSFETPSTCQ